MRSRRRALCFKSRDGRLHEKENVYEFVRPFAVSGRLAVALDMILSRHDNYGGSPMPFVFTERNYHCSEQSDHELNRHRATELQRNFDFAGNLGLYKFASALLRAFTLFYIMLKCFRGLFTGHELS